MFLLLFSTIIWTVASTVTEVKEYRNSHPEGEYSPQQKNAPHIMIIVADDLGFNDVTWHGSEQIPTPNLQRLAESGLVLDNYYVQPVCSPTRSSILTGRHVIHTSIYDPDCGPGNTKSVPLNFSMIPAHLNKLGYESHAIGKWHCGMFTKQAIPTGKGFKDFLGYYGGAEDYFTHEDKSANDMHNDTLEHLHIPHNKGIYSTFIYTQRAQELIKDYALRRDRGDTDGNFFMYLAYQAIHSPDEVPNSYKFRFNESIPDTPDGVGQHRRIVAGMIACLDEGIGNVTKSLEEAEMLDDTIIVFTTDNGGPAQGFNSNMASNWPLRGMKRTLWQGGVRGAAFIRGPGIRTSGQVSHDLIHATDWFPTLLTAAAGGNGDWQDVVALPGTGDEPAWEEGDGIDLWAVLSEGAKNPRTEVLIEAHNDDSSNKDDGNDGMVRQMMDGMNLDQTRTSEYKDIKDEQPEDYQRLLSRLKIYQATAKDVSFHDLPLCKEPTGPVNKPVDGNWMPVCP